MTAIDLHLAGLIPAEIARRRGITRQGVYLALKRAGLTPNRTPRRHDPTRVVELAKSGKTRAEIAFALGASVAHVQHLLRAAGAAALSPHANTVARDAMAAPARAMMEYGYGVYTIRGALGITATTWHNWIRAGLLPKTLCRTPSIIGVSLATRADLAQRLLDDGHTPDAVARLLGVSDATVQRWRRLGMVRVA